MRRAHGRRGQGAGVCGQDRKAWALSDGVFVCASHTVGQRCPRTPALPLDGAPLCETDSADRRRGLLPGRPGQGPEQEAGGRGGRAAARVPGRPAEGRAGFAARTRFPASCFRRSPARPRWGPKQMWDRVKVAELLRGPNLYLAAPSSAARETEAGAWGGVFVPLAEGHLLCCPLDVPCPPSPALVSPAPPAAPAPPPGQGLELPRAPASSGAH